MRADLLGIEIGGTKLQLGIGPGDGTIARLARLPVDPSRHAEGIRSRIREAFRSLDAEIAAVGIGFGGPVDPARGVVTKSHQVEGWDGFPLVDWVRSELGVSQVALANDADAAALGEALFGAGRGLSPVLYVNSGSGIGGGLIVDGKIYRGSGLGAIEIGHLLIDENERDAENPSWTTLEGIASGWAISARGRIAACGQFSPQAFGNRLIELADGDPERVDARIVVESARAGDPAARNVLRRAVVAMAEALGHAITLLAPSRVILGGGVSLMGDDLWLDPIRELVEARVFPPFRGSFDMKTAELGEDVVVHGALALARDMSDFNTAADNRLS